MIITGDVHRTCRGWSYMGAGTTVDMLLERVETALPYLHRVEARQRVHSLWPVTGRTRGLGAGRIPSAEDFPLLAAESFN